MAATAIGTKGGELMKATDETTIESASTRSRRQSRACIASDTKTAKLMKAMWLRPPAKSKSEKSAVEAIARLNI